MKDDQGIAIAQWIPSSVQFQLDGAEIGLSIEQDGQHGLYPLNKWSVTGMKAITEVHTTPIPAGRPDIYLYRVTVNCSRDAEFALKLRLPWWVAGPAAISVNGVDQGGMPKGAGFYELSRLWSDGDTIEISLPKGLVAEPLPGAPGTFAFVDGPVVLVGLIDHDCTLKFDAEQPESMLQVDRERNHSWWNAGYYRTTGQSKNFRFIPLNEVKDEIYTIYFPVVAKLNQT